MKTQKKPSSKILIKKSNTNKKKPLEIDANAKTPRSYLLKKNEFVLIIFGALLLAIIIFFFFFRSSDFTTQTKKPGFPSASYTELEERITNLEKKIQDNNNDIITIEAKDKPSDTILKDRVARLETALTIKIDTLIEKMETNEKNISLLKGRSVIKPVQTSKTQASKTKVSSTKAEIPVKKSMKKKPLFHTVKKQETLYSISKKYNINVEKLRKLNQLSKAAKIYPEDNLIVR